MRERLYTAMVRWLLTGDTASATEAAKLLTFLEAAPAPQASR